MATFEHAPWIDIWLLYASKPLVWRWLVEFLYSVFKQFHLNRTLNEYVKNLITQERNFGNDNFKHFAKWWKLILAEIYIIELKSRVFILPKWLNMEMVRLNLFRRDYYFYLNIFHIDPLLGMSTFLFQFFSCVFIAFSFCWKITCMKTIIYI